MKNKWIIILCILIFVVAIMDGFLIFNNKKNLESSNEPSKNSYPSSENSEQTNFKDDVTEYICIKTDESRTDSKLNINYQYKLQYNFVVLEDKRITGSIDSVFQFQNQTDYEKYVSNINFNETGNLERELNPEQNIVISKLLSIFPNNKNSDKEIFTEEYFDVIETYGFKNCQEIR